MRAGDLIEVDFGLPTGSEAGFRRPAVVVSADLVLEARPRTLHVVPITNVRRSLPSEVVVSGGSLDHPSAAQCHLATAISSQRIVAHDGTNVGRAALAQIRSVLADLLDLP